MKTPIFEGERFGFVIAELKIPGSRQKPGKWVCKCDCGRRFLTISSSLRSGNTGSCGCKSSRHTIGKRSTTHGDSETLIYARWCAMLNRCRNPKVKSYPYYGGRGIKVCDRWHSFENFLADMGMPEPGMLIERVDNDGDYTPENCVWASRIEQARNRRSNIHLTFNGETRDLFDWSASLGVTRDTLYHRYRQGWAIERILQGYLRHDKGPRRRRSKLGIERVAMPV